MQKLIEESMINARIEEGMLPEQVFFAFLCCWLYHFGLSSHELFVYEGSL